MHAAKGKTSSVSMQPHDTVATLKSKLQDQAGVPARLQQLLFNGRQLDEDEATLQSYHVQNWSKILLLPQQETKADSYEVPIKTLSGKGFLVQARPGDTVEDICAKIHKKEGVPLEQQQLIYGGKVLDWDMTLDHYSIQQGSALHMVCAPSQRKVFLRLPDSSWTKASTIPITVLLKDTVESLPKKVAEKFKVPVGSQKVFFVGRCLENAQPLSQCSIESGSIIDIQILEGREDEANVDSVTQVLYISTPAGQQSVRLECRPTDSVASVKDQVRSLLGYEVSRQLLLLAGQPMDDAMTLNSYNLSNKTTLHLVLRSEPETTTTEQVGIFVRLLTGNTLSLSVSPSDTMRDIRSKIEQTTGVACDQQRLLLKGRPLDDTVRLRDCNIETESTFYLALVPPSPADNPTAAATTSVIFVRNLLGKNVAIEVSSGDTVGALKEKVSAKEGIPADQQKLVLRGVELHDEQLLASCNISQESNLQLTLRVPAEGGEGGEEVSSLCIRTLTGKTLTIKIPSRSTVGELKQRVHAMEGLPPAQQKLILDGVELPDEARLDSYPLNMHTTLQLVVRPHPLHEDRDLFVKTPLGRTVTLTVSSGQRVGEVKAVLGGKEGILPARQRLLFQGQELEDDKCLWEYGIERESNLIMVLRESDDGATVSVKMPTGEAVSVPLQAPSSTVAAVKLAIQQLRGMSITRQDLMDKDRVSLRDDASVSAGEELEMALRPVSLSVLVCRHKPGARVKSLSLSNARTPDHVLESVQASLGIEHPPSCLRLFHDGKMLDGSTWHLVEQEDVLVLGE